MKRLCSIQVPGDASLCRTAGVSLVELAIAIGVGITLMSVLGRILIGTTSSLDYIVKDTVSVQNIQYVVMAIRDELRDSKPSAITIVTGTDNDTLTFQDSRMVGTAMDYGTEDTSGAWQSGWTIRYRVVGANLVRDAIDTGGAVVSSGIVAQYVDVTAGAPKGFSVSKSGNLYTISVTVNKTFADQKSYSKTMQSAVLVEN